MLLSEILRRNKEADTPGRKDKEQTISRLLFVFSAWLF
jgi:hypothetical protein